MAIVPITYQEVANAIASILTLHPQFDKVFTAFESLPWMPIPHGMMKKQPNGATMTAKRDKITNKVKIVLRAGVNLKEC